MNTEPDAGEWAELIAELVDLRDLKDLQQTDEPKEVEGAEQS